MAINQTHKKHNVLLSFHYVELCIQILLVLNGFHIVSAFFFGQHIVDKNLLSLSRLVDQLLSWYFVNRTFHGNSDIGFCIGFVKFTKYCVIIAFTKANR